MQSVRTGSQIVRSRTSASGTARSDASKNARAASRKLRAAADSESALSSTLKDPLDNSIPFLLRRTSRYFRLALQNRLRRHGLGFSHWFYLRALWLEDGITQRELCKRIESVEPAAVTALSGLERGGYIRRLRDEHNRRQVKIFITPKGRALESDLMPFAERISAAGVAGVPERELAIVRRVLNRIRSNMAKADFGDTAE